MASTPSRYKNEIFDIFGYNRKTKMTIVMARAPTIAASVSTT
jgi:hypothetical protein